MIPVELHIQYLLSRHDCVIVPHFGAFIARYMPAHLSADGSSMVPPARIVGFNPDVDHNDGLLTAGIVRREGVSYETASAAVDALVNEWQGQLTLHGVFSIPRIGSFTRSENGALLFEPAPGCIADMSHLGLPVVRLADTQGDSVAISTVDIKAKIRRPLRTRLRRVAGMAASVMVLMLLALTLATPTLSDFGLRTDYAALGTTSSSPVTDQDIMPAAAHPLPVSTDATWDLYVPAQEDATVAVIAGRRAPAKAEETRHRCFLIVGSFDTRRKANEWIGQQQGEPLEIIIGDGHVRVYAATGATVAEASRLKSDPDFNSRHPEAWVYVR